MTAILLSLALGQTFDVKPGFEVQPGFVVKQADALPPWMVERVKAAAKRKVVRREPVTFPVSRPAITRRASANC